MSLLQFIEVNFYLAVFFVLYRLVFEKSGFFKLNRLLLLTLPLAAFIIPYFQWGSEASAQPNQVLETFVVLGDQEVLTNAGNEVDFKGWLLIIGGTISLLLLSFNLYKILKRKSISDRFEYKGKNVQVLEESIATYSFFNQIYLNKSDLANKEIILEHELAHVEQKHSLDIIYIQVVKAVLWFNPIVYSLEKMIRENHEYLADQQVGAEMEIRKYAMSILESAFGVETLPLSSAFSNRSLIGKRVEMLTKKKPKSKYIMKYLLIIPVAGGLMYFSACTKSADEASDVSSKVTAAEAPEKEVVFDSEPEFNGDLYAYLGGEIKYPEVAKENGEQGTVYVGFNISEDGSIVDAKVNKGVSPSLDAEALRVINEMPVWKPGVKDGKPVKVEFTLPIKFQLDDEPVKEDRTEVIESTRIPEETDILKAPEDIPMELSTRLPESTK